MYVPALHDWHAVAPPPTELEHDPAGQGVQRLLTGLHPGWHCAHTVEVLGYTPHPAAHDDVHAPPRTLAVPGAHVAHWVEDVAPAGELVPAAQSTHPEAGNPFGLVHVLQYVPTPHAEGEHKSALHDDEFGAEHVPALHGAQSPPAVL